MPIVINTNIEFIYGNTQKHRGGAERTEEIVKAIDLNS